jgi:hypothetical protein
LIGFSERSVRRSGDIGSPHPPRRLNDHEVFRRSACRSVRRPPDGSRKLHLPLRVRAAMPSPVQQDRVAPPGVSRPFSDVRRRDPYVPGHPLARHCPSSGFLTPSTGCSPSGLADTLGPLPLLGFLLWTPFRAERPWCIAAPLRPFVHGALQPRTLRNTRSESSADLKTLEPIRPGRTAVFPGLPSPLRSTSSKGRRRDFRPC